MGVVVTTTLLLAIWFYAYMKMTPLVPEPSSYSTIASHLVGSSDSFSLSSFWSSRPREHKYRVWRTVFVLILMEIPNQLRGGEVRSWQTESPCLVLVIE